MKVLAETPSSLGSLEATQQPQTPAQGGNKAIQQFNSSSSLVDIIRNANPKKNFQ